MIGAKARYHQLRIELLFERAEGSLDQDVEANYASELDRIWNLLTDDERTEIEAELAAPPPHAPTDLDSYDIDVCEGESKLPRLKLD